ncbi:MAG: hypothetical protein IPH13_22340 [Planctomycetes bacterium]|nr:hypothetical protein [Planctomycetota bacterium]
MNPRSTLAGVVAAAFALAPLAAAQCVPTIDALPGQPGFDLEVFALTEFDAGFGSRLYAGGRFTHSGGVSVRGLAVWNGSSWDAVGSGVGGQAVAGIRAMTVFDDGNGPELYVAGNFSTIDGIAAQNVARFDGTSFHAVGAGLPTVVRALTTFDDGSGTRLFAGGDFTLANPGGVFRFDGTQWSIVAGGIDAGPVFSSGSVRALTTYDDGQGTELFAGGIFHRAGTATTHYIARFDGTSWSAVGSGLDEPANVLHVFDAGAGPELFVGGTFLHAGGVAAAHAARWDGTQWRDLGNASFLEFFGSIDAMTSLDDGSGPALLLAGSNGFGPTPIFRWDGGPKWTPLSTTFIGTILALSAFADECTTGLMIGGSITKVGTQSIGRCARLRGCATGPTTLVATTSPQLGTDLVLAGSSPGNDGRAYFCGFAFGASPGITLSQGTIVPLNVDPLLFASLDSGSPLFDDQFGVLTACAATTRFHLPPIPAAAGLSITSALVVFEPAAPDGIEAISAPLTMTLNP